MIRFCDKEIEKSIHKNIAIALEHITLGENVWKDGKEYFHSIPGYDTAEMWLLPVEKQEHKVCCYAYCDNEADRELRMLKELRANREALQFPDVFPQYEEVVLYGCNELAVSFARYLEWLGVTVYMIGNYWDSFGFMGNNGLNLLEGGGK